MHNVTDGVDGRLCGGLICDERVMRIWHNAVAAVRGQRRHPILQRQPSGDRIPRRGDHDQGPIAETLKRSGLGERRGKFLELISQTDIEPG